MSVMVNPDHKNSGSAVSSVFGMFNQGKSLANQFKAKTGAQGETVGPQYKTGSDPTQNIMKAPEPTGNDAMDAINRRMYGMDAAGKANSLDAEFGAGAAGAAAADSGYGAMAGGAADAVGGESMLALV